MPKPKPRTPAHSRNQSLQYSLRKEGPEVEYSLDLRSWKPERRKLKWKVRQKLTRKKFITGSAAELYADRGLRARGSGKRGK